MNIKIENVFKSYPKTDNVLNDISIDLKNVSCVGIIGSSGCGKSTLLRQLSGIEKPDSGKITINNLSPIKQKRIFQSKIGVVFQQHNLFPHLTVKKNITLILEKILKQNKHTAEMRAEEVLKQLFIFNEKDKKPAEISGGQAQRASIARALATNPELIFLDEPTAALDPILTAEVLKAITQLKKDGINFIFVTHEISFLKEFADYVIFLDKGKICEHGEIARLENPKTEKLKEFLKN